MLNSALFMLRTAATTSVTETVRVTATAGLVLSVYALHDKINSLKTHGFFNIASREVAPTLETLPDYYINNQL